MLPATFPDGDRRGREGREGAALLGNGNSGGGGVEMWKALLAEKNVGEAASERVRVASIYLYVLLSSLRTLALRTIERKKEPAD